MTTAGRRTQGGPGTSTPRWPANVPQRATDRFFAEPVHDYVMQCLGRPVSVLQAGCLAPLRELDIGQLADGGFEIAVDAVDTNHPLATRVFRDTSTAYDRVYTGDLRTVPIPQRGYDILFCASLLEHVQHAELVLDRLVSAVKPGGLLLLRVADRGCAGGLLDRLLPGPIRRMLWSRFRPGTPGPFPAVYERLACDAGIVSYAQLRGLVIAGRTREDTLPDDPARLSALVRTTRAAIAGITRDRYDNSHDELLYVIRKPQDRFARVV